MKKKWDLTRLRAYEARGLVRGRKHPEYPLTVWNYTPETQFSKNWDEVTMACRGMVTEDDGTVVAPCIPKFFNFGEVWPGSAKFSLNDAEKLYNKAFEKLDGSMITIFNYYGTWHAASRGSFESDQAKWAQELLTREFTSKFPGDNWVFLAELIHPDNRIVLDYEGRTELVLLNTFVKGHEEWLDLLNPTPAFWNGPCAKEVSVESAMRNVINNVPGIEGYILMSGDNRVKIKTSDYVELHRVVTNVTTKNTLRRWESNDTEWMKQLPDELQDRVMDVYTRASLILKDKVDSLKSVYELYGAIEDQKEFALVVLRHHKEDAGLLFSMRAGKSVYPSIASDIVKRYEELEIEL